MNAARPFLSRPSLSAVNRRRRHRLYAGLLMAGLICVLLLLAGFIAFTTLLARHEPALTGRADGIVVLTGGTSRIEDGLELLSAGRAGRMLITGVNRTTRPEDLARHVTDAAHLLDCCVDVDKAAMNTLGNALETRRWVTSHQFRSLIVVTSSYHMPRALAEFAYVMPQVELIPFPVITPRIDAGVWWKNSTTARLLIGEYLKYVVAKVRISLTVPPAPAGLARMAP